MALIDTVAGREILQSLACWLAKRRGSRRLHRSFYIAFDEWKNTGAFSLETLENSLNAVDVQEVEDLNDLLVQLGCSDIGEYNGGVYHVNSTTGSDETGDGSDARPFASLAFLSSPFFPKYIDHEVRILVDGTVTEDELVLDQTIGPDGSLSLIGVGAPVIQTTSQGDGPFALTGVNTYNTPIAAYEFQVAETFGVDELYGKWIKFTTGDFANQCFPVHTNSASSLWTRSGWSGTPNIGDEFVIVQIASTIVCPKINIQINGPIYDELAKFNLYNLNIDLRDSYSSSIFRLNNSVFSQVSLTRLITQSGQVNSIRLDSDLNIYKAFDVGAAILASSGITNLDDIIGGATNCGLMAYRDSFPPASNGLSEIVAGNERSISCVDCRSVFYIYGNVKRISFVAAGSIRADVSGSSIISQCFITPTNTTTDIAIEIIKVGSYKIEENYFGGPGAYIFSVENGNIEIGENTYAATYAQYGIRFSFGSATVSTRVSPVALTGTAGDIYFRGGVGATAHPAADAIVTDGLGNSFAYISSP